MPDTGGVNIGPIGQLEGQILGLSTVMRHASKTPEYAELGRQLRAAKDYNDAPVARTVGSTAGKRVVDGGLAAL